MVNYYEILEVDQNSPSSEIKRSFRKKAKQIHPDLQESNKASSEERMKVLLRAYKVLIDPVKREEYDRFLRRYQSQYRFDYREFLQRRKDDLRSQSKLIFYDLLNRRSDNAIELFLELEDKGIDIENYLSRDDYMDCIFLLAEAFIDRGDYIRGYELYRKLYICELEKPYFHHFIEEVIDRLRDVVCFKMVNCVSAEQLLHYLHELVSFNFSNKDTAFFYKKIAEIYSSLGKNDAALYYLQKGLELNRKLSGVKKLKDKIGFSESSTF